MLSAILGLAGSSLASAGFLVYQCRISDGCKCDRWWIGSLLQGGTTEDALQAGLLGGIGGFLGGKGSGNRNI